MDEKGPTFATFLKRKDMLYILMLGLVVVVGWIAMSIYGSLNKSTVPPNVTKQTTPLNPLIDIDTLNTLKSRTVYTKEDLQGFTINTKEEEKPGATPSPKPSLVPST